MAAFVGGAVPQPAAAAAPPPYRPLLQQDPELRRLKEAFVSNLAGTTRWEVFCVLSSMPLCLLIAAYVEARITARLRSTKGGGGGSGSSSGGAALHRRLRRALARAPKLGYEFVGGVVPLLLLCMSVAPAEPAFLLLFLLWGSLALKLWMRAAHGPTAASRAHMAHMVAHLSAPRKRFVSAFRGGVMAATCLAILAVDFAAFPRRYAKAEGHGGGVMDVGVGAIVFAGGLVSAVAATAATAAAGGTAGSAAAAAAGPAGAGAPAAAGAAGPRPPHPPGGRGGGGGGGGRPASAAAAPPGSAWLRRVLRGVRAALPLLLLGGARHAATAAVGYQAHLGEYGVHWNFFYTIAGVALLTLALPVPPRWLGLLGLALSGAHQLALSADLGRLAALLAAATGGGSGGGAPLPARLAQLLPGLLAPAAPAGAAAAAAAGAGGQRPPSSSLGAWLHAELPLEARLAAGFWASNKEGLGSLPGYWALHLLGAAAGHHLGASCAWTAAAARGALVAGGDARARAGVAECGRRVWAWVGAWWVVDLVLWGALAAAEAGLEPVSRRACNLPYVLWTCAQCLAWLLLVLMAELLTSIICATSGGCGVSSSGAALSLHCAPAAAAGLPAAAAAGGGGRGPPSVRRSLDAAATLLGAAGPVQQAVAQQQQQQPLRPPGSPAAGAGGSSSSLHRRSVGRRGGGSGGGAGAGPPPAPAAVTFAAASSSSTSPIAAAAAAVGAALTAAAVGSGGIAGGASAAVAAAAVVDSSSSREGSPRKPQRGAAAGAAGGQQQQQQQQPAGSPRAPGSGGGGGPGSASSAQQPSGRGSGGRRPGGSRLQPQAHHQQPQPPLAPPPPQPQPQPAEQGGSASTSGPGSSGGPMRLLLAFNRNMLALFLAANLMTGAINLCVNTLAVGAWAARGIVGCYMLVLCVVAVRLDAAGITLKAW